MARPRLRLKRLLLVLAALLLVFLLLSLNRLLPGGWPGGGGSGGYREVAAGGRDVRRVRSPRERSPPWPREGIVVRLVAADGGPAADGRLDVGEDTAENLRADGAGLVSIPSGRVRDEGFVVRARGRRVRHGGADPGPARTWVVHLPPAGPSPEEARALEVRVRAAEDDAPLRGATAEVTVGGRTWTARATAEGVLDLGGAVGRTRLRLSAEGRETVERWIHAPATGRVEVALRRLEAVEVRLVDEEDGLAASPERLRVLGPGGEVRFDAGRPGPGPVDLVLPEGEWEGALVELGGGEWPVCRVPAGALASTVRLPRGRTLEVEVRREGDGLLGEPLLTAHYVPEVLGDAASPLEPSEVAVSGRSRLVLPEGRGASVLVEAPGAAPHVLALGPEDPAGRRVLALPAGATLRVRVLGAGGEPVAGADVIAVGALGGFRVERRARTGEDGRAALAHLPAGSLEIYARAPGHAWGSRVTEDPPPEVEVVLRLGRGGSLRLVVEDPLGLPLEGVRVHATPEEGGTPDVVPPGARPWRTGRDGTLLVEDLPVRPYRLRLSLPGYEDRVLHHVRPGGEVHFATLEP